MGAEAVAGVDGRVGVGGLEADGTAGHVEGGEGEQAPQAVLLDRGVGQVEGDPAGPGPRLDLGGGAVGRQPAAVRDEDAARDDGLARGGAEDAGRAGVGLLQAETRPPGWSGPLVSSWEAGCPRGPLGGRVGGPVCRMAEVVPRG
ncbi:hypothetical protein GCM10027075_58500 [Streptomyces heilongjiangensis]